MRKNYRVTVIKLGAMNRSKTFEHFEDVEEYVNDCFKRSSNMIVVVRPDDTAAVYLSADMRIVNQPKLGSYSVCEIASVRDSDHIKRLSPNGLEPEEVDADPYQLQLNEYALNSAI